MKRNESQWPPSSQPLYSRWQGNTGSTNQYQLLYIFSGVFKDALEDIHVITHQSMYIYKYNIIFLLNKLKLMSLLIIESRQAQGAVFPQMSIQPADTSQLEQLLHF